MIFAFSWEVIEHDGSATARFAVCEDAEDYCEYLATIGIAAKVRELPGPGGGAGDTASG